MICKLNKILELPITCEHKQQGTGTIVNVILDTAHSDIVLCCSFKANTQVGISWAHQRKYHVLSFDRTKMGVCGKVHDALKNQASAIEVDAYLDTLIPAEAEEEVTVEEIVEEMEAYYDAPAEVLIAEFEVTEEDIEAATQEYEAEVSYEEASPDSELEAEAVPTRQGKKRRK
jgi:hypothetical protein